MWERAFRSVTVLALSAAAVCAARAQQSVLPATSPTSVPVSAALPAAVAAPSPAPAVVTFNSGKLGVVAGGSGLNEILMQISRLASVTIVGRANEEPVFGTYGPASIGDVLSDLLEGSGSNMLLREPTAARPGELILTPRSGGGSADASSFNPAPAVYSAPRESYVRPQYPAPPPQAWGVQQQSVAPSPYMPPQPAGGNAGQPSAGPGVPASGPLTPEQIYQQLQRIQQSQPHP
jgi:hypothetical protein